MAETTVTAVRLTNIVSIKQGDYVIKGVRAVTISTNKGRIMPVLEEGKKYVTGAENVGLPDFPVTTQVVFEQGIDEMTDALGYAVGNLVITCKAAGAAANQVTTIVNHQFRQFSINQGLQDFGKPQIEGVAYSADGDALPISTAPAA